VFLKRQIQLKSCAALASVGYLDVAAMRFDDSTANRQAKPYPTLRAFWMDSEKFIENFLL